MEPKIGPVRLPRPILKERNVRVMIAVIVFMVASVLTITMMSPSDAGETGDALQASVRQTAQK
ncbi:hypothetical protein [Rhizobium sp. LjRoot258]|uniref:hypothetical protein n=1 Tax=Rhizobium sp. LjRoot258 TaxID=3342299 RepID=UPI003ECE85BB